MTTVSYPPPSPHTAHASHSPSSLPPPNPHPKPRTVSAPSPPSNLAPTSHTLGSPRHPSNPTQAASASSRKPILTWLHRKLQSARRASSSLPSPNLAAVGRGAGQGNGKYQPLGHGPTTGPSHRNGHNPANGSNQNNGTPLETYPRRARPLTTTTINTSLSGGTGHTGGQGSLSLSLSGRISPTSDYPPTHLSADDDASTRPLPPTSPPSPAPSRHTYSSLTGSVRSGSTGTGYQPSTVSMRGSSFAVSASTKPTTLLSIESAPGVGVGAGPAGGWRTHPAPSIHFSHLPPSSPTPSGPSVPQTPTQTSAPFSAMDNASGSSGAPSTATAGAGPPAGSVEGKLAAAALRPRAPRYSLPNPSHNPEPGAPAQDNASILTLASTTGGGRRPGSFYPASRLGADGGEAWDAYGYGYGYGGEEGAGDDGGASVRAIKPRSRRGSWGTERTGGTFGTGMGLDGGSLMNPLEGGEGAEGGEGEGEGVDGISLAGSVPIGHRLERLEDERAERERLAEAEAEGAGDGDGRSSKVGSSLLSGEKESYSLREEDVKEEEEEGRVGEKEGMDVVPEKGEADLVPNGEVDGEGHTPKGETAAPGEGEGVTPPAGSVKSVSVTGSERGERGRLSVPSGEMELDTPVPRGRVLEGEE